MGLGLGGEFVVGKGFENTRELRSNTSSAMGRRPRAYACEEWPSDRGGPQRCLPQPAGQIRTTDNRAE
jgi:hypothetical protein